MIDSGYLFTMIQTFTPLQKGIADQDVESQEGSKICDVDQDTCYGSLTVTGVNLTLVDDSIVELLEIQIKKGCAKSNDLPLQANAGTYNEDRRCWTTQVHQDNKAQLFNNKYVLYVF